MLRLESILLHSVSADGYNAWRLWPATYKPGRARFDQTASSKRPAGFPANRNATKTSPSLVPIILVTEGDRCYGGVGRRELGLATLELW